MPIRIQNTGFCLTITYTCSVFVPGGGGSNHHLPSSKIPLSPTMLQNLGDSRLNKRTFFKCYTSTSTIPGLYGTVRQELNRLGTGTTGLGKCHSLY